MVFLDATIDKGFRLNSELLVDGGGEDRHFNLKYKDIKLKQIWGVYSDSTLSASCIWSSGARIGFVNRRTVINLCQYSRDDT